MPQVNKSVSSGQSLLQKQESDCFITPTDIAVFRTTEEVSNKIGTIVDSCTCKKSKIETFEIEIAGLISRIEELAICKKWQDRGYEWFIEKVWWLWDRLKNNPLLDCQRCACWHLISWWQLPSYDQIDLIDFKWDDSILSFLIREYSHLVNLETTH